MLFSCEFPILENFGPLKLIKRNEGHNDMDPVDVCCGNNDGCSIGKTLEILRVSEIES